MSAACASERASEKTMLWPVLFYLVWAINSAVVCGDYTLVVEFHSLANPTNRQADGSCCVCCETEGSCSDSCTVDLQVCIRPAGSNHSDPSCPVLGLYGPPSPRVSTWRFNGAWPGAIQLYIRATHTIGDPDQSTELIDDIPIDNVYIEISNINSSSPPTPHQNFTGVGGRVEAEIAFEVNCVSDYYGPYCDCQDRNDSLGHYQCNIDGSRECLEGYQNAETNCIECVAADGCSLSGGYCINPGDCICKADYSEENCSQVVSSTMELSTALSVPSTTHHSASPSLLAVSSDIRVTPSLTHSLSVTSSLSDSESVGVILLPTVGGVVPASASTRSTINIHLPIYMVAGVGGLLLITMLIVCIATLFVVPWRRKRVYEITTSTNGTTQTDENRLLESTISSSCQIENATDASFTTFMNPEQTQPRELHVYYHRNTPEPPSAEEGDGDEESGDNDAAVESMEMDFPSGYTDENYLQWSSVLSGSSEYLSKSAGSNGTVNNPFNDYQFN